MRRMIRRAVSGALAAALPTIAAAAQFTMTIEGVDPGSPPSAMIALPVPGMFVGLGVCNPVANVGNSCNGSPPTPAVALNPLATPLQVQEWNQLNGTNFTNAAIFGYGHPVDQVIFHQLTFQFQVGNAGVTPIGANTPAQAFDFVVGNTGGGSAGVGGGGFLHTLNLARRVRIYDGNTVYLDTNVTQWAELLIGDYEDTLNILASDAVSVNLGASGTIRFQLKGLAHPVTAGDPDLPILLNSVPLPSTFGLVALGLVLAGLGGGWRRGRAAVPLHD